MLDFKAIGKLASRIARVRVLDPEWLNAYDLVSTLESGKDYQVGAPQGLTRLLMAELGTYPSSKLLLTRSDLKKLDPDAVAREFIDYSAIAPLNLSLGRIKTYSDLSRQHRGGIRFRVLQMVEPDQRADFASVMGRLQFAALSVSPEAILDRDLHHKYWVNWGATARALKNESNWQPMAVCVTTEDGVEHKGWL